MGKTLRLGSIRYCEAQNEIAFLFERTHLKFPLFDEDQQPPLHGKSPQQGLRDLYQVTVNNTERAIGQNIDYATTLLSRMQLIKNRLIPIMPYSHEEWEEEAFAAHEKVNDVLKRIDDLMYICRERSALLDMKLI